MGESKRRLSSAQRAHADRLARATPMNPRGFRDDDHVTVLDVNALLRGWEEDLVRAGRLPPSPHQLHLSPDWERHERTPAGPRIAATPAPVAAPPQRLVLPGHEGRFMPPPAPAKR